MVLTSARVDELVKDDRVHVSIYNDEAVYQEELKRIFYTTWVYLGHESEIKQAGDYKSTYIGLVPVIVSRDEDGQIYGLINRCMHRGTTVCQRETGSANFFRCEYHGWVYSNNGSLIGVGGRRGYGPTEIVESELGLARVARIDSYRGFIFGSMASEGDSLADHLGLAKVYLDEFCDKSPTGEVDVAGGVYKHVYRGNWKLQLEGANEGYHPSFMHRVSRLARERNSGSSRGGNAPRVPQGKKVVDVSNTGIDLGNGHSLMSALGGVIEDYSWDDLEKQYPTEYLEKLVKRQGKERTLQVLTHGWRMMIFPNAAFDSGTNIRVMRPLSVSETEIRQYNVLVPDAPDSVNLRKVRGHEDFYGPAGFGSPDDIEIFARMDEGYRAGNVHPDAQWALFNRGITAQTTGPHGERRGHVGSEIEQRAIYYAWRALMKGESLVSIAG